ncbi:ParA family protein [Pseudomonas aeruginosa]|uniref:ParA family protein n=1 Tax=Pseudomonas aeruginosa TaxID=287 RepID=UPI000E69E348|nr:AAA family ATPase [Pseudomonas aeruginosa]MBA5107691.1 AAA family ATPase [Pseudomonas aeruginosa]MBD1300142.1 AAA family ATPase [Pseudomonas aeruginosa]MBD1340707.1 AAA family ATPase [Pseudomonas aeruginosa]MBG4604280.1 AAA family ATPase [Pseudomonas aeruginosa]MBH3592845.1 AAA family ATPase [Pseudomonas aeruginosa]
MSKPAATAKKGQVEDLSSDQADESIDELHLDQENTPVETRILAIANHKGGVGKTTTAVNLADCLAQKGHWVLVVDLDPQNNASQHIGQMHPARVEYNACELLSNQRANIEAFIYEETQLDGVHLIYGSISLENVDEVIRNEYPRPVEVLKERLKPLIGKYDYIIIDCPPSLKLLTQNALAAATHYIVPVESGAPYAINGLDDLKRRVEKVMMVNPKLIFLGALLIKHDERQILCRENESDAISLFGKLIPVKISTTTKVNQSIAQKMSVRMAERTNKVSRQYVDLADYIADVTTGKGLLAEGDA